MEVRPGLLPTNVNVNPAINAENINQSPCAAAEPPASPNACTERNANRIEAGGDCIRRVLPRMMR